MMRTSVSFLLMTGLALLACSCGGESSISYGQDTSSPYHDDLNKEVLKSSNVYRVRVESPEDSSYGPGALEVTITDMKKGAAEYGDKVNYRTSISAIFHPDGGAAPVELYPPTPHIFSLWSRGETLENFALHTSEPFHVTLMSHTGLHQDLTLCQATFRDASRGQHVSYSADFSSRNYFRCDTSVTRPPLVPTTSASAP